MRATARSSPTRRPSRPPDTGAAAAFYDERAGATSTRFGVPFRENPRIVRGLDYYSHTAFEFVTDRLGAQGTVMAGGRYDGLVEEMGGPPTPCRRLGGRDRAAVACCWTPPTRPRRAPSPSSRWARPPKAPRSTLLQALRARRHRRRDRLQRQPQAPDGARQPHRRPRRRHHRRGRDRRAGVAQLKRPRRRHAGERCRWRTSRRASR